MSCHSSEPAEASSKDPEVLRAALLRESVERRRAECLPGMQAEIVQLAIDQLVRQPDVEGFFGALTQTVVEEGESFACGVWLVDESGTRCELWLAYVKDRLFRPRDNNIPSLCPAGGPYPCEDMGRHLYDFLPGWTKTIGGGFFSRPAGATRCQSIAGKIIAGVPGGLSSGTAIAFRFRGFGQRATCMGPAGGAAANSTDARNE